VTKVLAIRGAQGARRAASVSDHVATLDELRCRIVRPDRCRSARSSGFCRPLLAIDRRRIQPWLHPEFAAISPLRAAPQTTSATPSRWHNRCCSSRSSYPNPVRGVDFRPWFRRGFFNATNMKLLPAGMVAPLLSLSTPTTTCSCPVLAVVRRRINGRPVRRPGTDAAVVKRLRHQAPDDIRHSSREAVQY